MDAPTTRKFRPDTPFLFLITLITFSFWTFFALIHDTWTSDFFQSGRFYVFPGHQPKCFKTPTLNANNIKSKQFQKTIFYSHKLDNNVSIVLKFHFFIMPGTSPFRTVKIVHRANFFHFQAGIWPGTIYIHASNGTYRRVQAVCSIPTSFGRVCMFGFSFRWGWDTEQDFVTFDHFLTKSNTYKPSGRLTLTLNNFWLKCFQLTKLDIVNVYIKFYWKIKVSTLSLHHFWVSGGPKPLNLPHFLNQ